MSGMTARVTLKMTETVRTVTHQQGDGRGRGEEEEERGGRGGGVQIPLGIFQVSVYLTV